MTSCCSKACWYVLAAAIRVMSLLMQQLKPYSWECVSLDIVPLPLFLIQQQEAQHSSTELSKAVTQKHMRERSQTLPILHGSFLSLPIHPITQPGSQRSQSLALHSSAPKTAVITGFRGTFASCLFPT